MWPDVETRRRCSLITRDYSTLWRAHCNTVPAPAVLLIQRILITKLMSHLHGISKLRHVIWHIESDKCHLNTGSIIFVHHYPHFTAQKQVQVAAPTIPHKISYKPLTHPSTHYDSDNNGTTIPFSGAPWGTSANPSLQSSDKRLTKTSL